MVEKHVGDSKEKRNKKEIRFGEVGYCDLRENWSSDRLERKISRRR